MEIYIHLKLVWKLIRYAHYDPVIHFNISSISGAVYHVMDSLA